MLQEFRVNMDLDVGLVHGSELILSLPLWFGKRECT